MKREKLWQRNTIYGQNGALENTRLNNSCDSLYIRQKLKTKMLKYQISNAASGWRALMLHAVDIRPSFPQNNQVNHQKNISFKYSRRVTCDYLYWLGSQLIKPESTIIMVDNHERQLIQSSAVITRSNIVRYYTKNYGNSGRISIKCWIHKIHPIPRPNVRAMGVFCEYLWENWPRYNSIALYVAKLLLLKWTGTRGSCFATRMTPRLFCLLRM